MKKTDLKTLNNPDVDITKKSRLNAAEKISEALSEFEGSFSDIASKRNSEEIKKISQLFTDTAKRIESISEEISVKMDTYDSKKDDGFDEAFDRIEAVEQSVDDLENVSDEIRNDVKKELTNIKKYVDGIKGNHENRIKMTDKQLGLIPSMIDGRMVEIKKTFDLQIFELVGNKKKKSKKEFEDIWGKLTEFSELVSKHYKDGNWGGGSTSVNISKNGSLTGSTFGINFKDSATVTAVVSVNQQLGIDVSFTATGGSGSGFQLPTSGLVNGSNKTYVFATAPNAINVDGNVYFKTTQDASATAIWTGTTSITFVSLTPNSFCGGVA